MKQKLLLSVCSGLLLASVATGQTQPEKKPATAAPPAASLVDSLVQRLSNELHAKTIAGDPIKVGSVTVIPILMVDLNFGGGAIAVPADSTGKPPASPRPGGDGFLMSGEARPVGFVAITKKGVEFLSVAAPGK
jgi:uncharacterized spore protein YtfJ